MTETDPKRVLAAVDFGPRHYQRVLLGLPFGIGTRRRGYYPHSGLVVGTIKHILFLENRTIRYDTRCYSNVRSKADTSQLNLPHGEP